MPFPDEISWSYDDVFSECSQSDTETHHKFRDNEGYEIDEDHLGRYEPWSGEHPNNLPRRVPPLSALQWAATKGIISTAQKAIDAAKIIWPEYVELGHPPTLHKPIHLAIINDHLAMARFLIEQEVASPTTTSGHVCLAPKYLCDLINHVAPNIQLRQLTMYQLNSIEDPFVLDSLGLSILRGHEDFASWLLERCELSRYTQSSNETDDDDDDDASTEEDDASAEEHNVSEEEDNASTEDEYLLPFSLTELEKQPAICPLHLAALVGMGSIVKRLIERGIAVNTICQQVQMTTALMWACARPENTAIVEMLLDRGADC